MNENWLNDIPQWTTRFSGFLSDIAGVVLVGTMLMTVYDIVARNLGFGSIEPVVELTTLAVVVIASFGLAITTIKAGHVIIDLFTRNNELRTNRLIDAFWLVIMAILLISMALLSVREGLTLHADGTTTEVLEWSLLTFYIPPVLGWLLAAFASIWIGVLVIWRRGRSQRPGDESLQQEE